TCLGRPERDCAPVPPVSLSNDETVGHEIGYEPKRAGVAQVEQGAQVLDPKVRKPVDPEQRLDSRIGRVGALPNGDVDGVRQANRESAQEVDCTRLDRTSLLFRWMEPAWAHPDLGRGPSPKKIVCVLHEYISLRHMRARRIQIFFEEAPWSGGLNRRLSGLGTRTKSRPRFHPFAP